MAAVAINAGGLLQAVTRPQVEGEAITYPMLLLCEQPLEVRGVCRELEFARFLKGVRCLIPAGPRWVAAPQEVEEVLRTPCARLGGFGPVEPVGAGVIRLYRLDHRRPIPHGVGVGGTWTTSIGNSASLNIFRSA